LLDRYLARSGVKAQQTNEPKPPDQPANLWEPADGPGGRDFGAHGAFDSVSHPHSPQQWVAQHYRPLVMISSAVAAAGIAVGSHASRH
jgi:hypothetical protein